MSRFAIMLVSALMWAPLLHAAPKDDALAAFQKFFPAFVKGNFKEVADRFAPDALFYGTLSPELVTAPEGVLQYFTTALSGPAVVKAIPLSATTMALTENIVLISGS